MSDYAAAKMAFVESLCPRKEKVEPRIRPMPDYGKHSHLVKGNDDAFVWIGGYIETFRDEVPTLFSYLERAMGNPHVAQPSKNVADALKHFAEARMSLIYARESLIAAGYAGTMLDTEDRE